MTMASRETVNNTTGEKNDHIQDFRIKLTIY